MINQLKEPVAVSAGLARQLAAKLCASDPVSGEDCSWYHGLWQDLRLLGLVATAEYQADFFNQACQRFASRNQPVRILISGSADYSILAHLQWACSHHGVAAAFTVVDVCETPLFLNRWYAGEVGCRIETERADIFEWRTSAAFDAICSHGFLSQFNPERRREVVAHWSRLLVPGGVVLAVNRVRPNDSSAEYRFSDEQARSFYRLVEQRIRESQSFSESDSAQVLERVRKYVRHLRGYPITKAQVGRLFEQGGFRVEALSSVVSGNPQNRGVSGPAIPAGAEHACVIATKVRNVENAEQPTAPEPRRRA